jgi:hypothetical protein
VANWHSETKKQPGVIPAASKLEIFIQSLFKNHPLALLWHIFSHPALPFLSILSKDRLQKVPCLRKNLLITNLKNEF